MELKERIKEELEPLKKELFNVVYSYNGSLQSCGYSAWVVNAMLREKLPGHGIRLDFGVKNAYDFGKQIHHYWTRVDNELNVDLTMGQFVPELKGQITISPELLTDFDYVVSRDRRHFLKKIGTANFSGQGLIDVFFINNNIEDYNCTAMCMISNPRAEQIPGANLRKHKNGKDLFTERAIRQLKKRSFENLTLEQIAEADVSKVENVIDWVDFSKTMDMNDDTMHIMPRTTKEKAEDNMIRFFDYFGLKLPCDWKN